MTSRRKATLDWEMVGEVGVDTGLVMLSDPSYWIGDRDEDDVRPWSDWPAFVDALLGESCRADGPQGLLHRGTAQLLYSEGHPGLGVVVTDFGGDGTYPVFVQRGPLGSIVAAMVRFDGQSP
jgi:hypothetical protein